MANFAIDGGQEVPCGNRLDREAARALAVLPSLPHRPVSGSDMAAISVHVEQEIGEPISLWPFSNSAWKASDRTQAVEAELPILWTVGYQLRQADRVQQARPYPPGNALPALGSTGGSATHFDRGLAILPGPEPHRTGLAKLKHLLRKCAARTVEAICAAIAHH